MIENKKLVLGILFLAIIAIVFINGCVQDEVPEIANEPETKLDNEGETEPSAEVKIYKGVWMPLLVISSYTPEGYFPEGLFLEGVDISVLEPIFADLDKAEEAGINTFAIQMSWKVDEQGKVSLFPGEKKLFASFISEAHARGFKIWLNPDIIYSRDVDGPAGLRTMPEELIENTDLIENFEAAIVETARFAEENDVEIFSPSSEMYVNLDFEKPGRKRSLKLIANIKPRIDAVYSGKICLRGEWPKPEFSAYSCFGPTVGAPRNEEEKNKLIDNINFQLQREDIEVELIIGELWQGNGWRGTPEESKRNFVATLEAVRGKVTGIFILDAGHLYSPPFPESFEDTIKEFYT